MKLIDESRLKRESRSVVQQQSRSMTALETLPDEDWKDFGSGQYGTVAQSTAP